jgi:pyrimidine operon attenuation protein/uracil phosphoribosyltransferase
VCLARADGIFCVMSELVLMDSAALGRALTRMAHEIVEHNPEAESRRLSASARKACP